MPTAENQNQYTTIRRIFVRTFLDRLKISLVQLVIKEYTQSNSITVKLLIVKNDWGT